jgi:hypothetical protein
MSRVVKMKLGSSTLIPPVALIKEQTYTEVYVYHLLIP